MTTAATSLAVLAISLAVLVGCGVALLVRRSPATPQAVKMPPVATKKTKAEEEPRPDDGRQRIALFFGTQIGTTEGFAKVLSPPRCLLFSLLYLIGLGVQDDYAVEDDEYQEKLKKENIALFFLATTRRT